MLFRPLLYLILIAAIAGAAIYAYRRFAEPSKSKHELSVEQIQRMGRLMLVRFSIKDVVTQTKQRPLFLPDATALLIVVGEVYAGIDLAKIKNEDITQGPEQVIVKLPRCQILTHKVNLKKTQIYDVQWGGFKPWVLVAGALKAAEDKIREAAIDLGFAEPCKQQAHALLEPMFTQIANKKVVIKF
ncbi:MAG: hypothetical protein A3G25_05465 [Betaproteobacteria bacterium RIFCSPLOWO2_12_FULL_63_13]|nr:MAG: hypothetical protein A3G25_05465 [Betaproteobacteria bacterium RIFCSPLOWO2_12_FULL_63_13]